MAWRGFKYDGVLHCLFQKQNPLQTIDLFAKGGLSDRCSRGIQTPTPNVVKWSTIVAKVNLKYR